MPSGEISTAPIVYESLARGKQVFVPYTHKALSPNPDLPKSVMDMVSLKSRDDYESLKPDAWGIPTPSRDSILEREDCLKEMEAQAQMVGDEEKSTIGLDMIVMPGMAFDSCLRRLGHGKGFYDFFLKRYQEHWDKGKGIKARVPILVGMALKEQVLADNLEIPTDETDWLLDRLIVGDGKVLHRGNSEVI
ncbi:MAG: hypothetical protein M1837_001662 [Sclerophora amabilis]|nr:MAG: hypothetical protein M1837_001662 [Sclerophora amabilis]